MKLIDELKKLEAAASPRPWEWSESHFSTLAVSEDGDDDELLLDGGSGAASEDDHKFIAAARNATPKLIAAIEVMVRLVDDLADMEYRYAISVLAEVRKLLDDDNA